MSTILPEAAELLAPVTTIDGFRLGCLIDASTGMVVASAVNPAGPAPMPEAAGGTTSGGSRARSASEPTRAG